jgi:hypothetical protein
LIVTTEPPTKDPVVGDMLSTFGTLGVGVALGTDFVGVAALQAARNSTPPVAAAPNKARRLISDPFARGKSKKRKVMMAPRNGRAGARSGKPPAEPVSLALAARRTPKRCYMLLGEPWTND